MSRSLCRTDPRRCLAIAAQPALFAWDAVRIGIGRSLARLLTLGLILFSASAAVADDLATVNQNIVGYLSSSGVMPSDSTVRGYMSSLTASGNWTDVNYADKSITVWSPANHLSRLQAMAQAYAFSSGTLKGDVTLRTDIVKAFDYWFSVNPSSSNWWYNQISSPGAMGNIMLILGNPTYQPTTLILSGSEQTLGLGLVSQSASGSASTFTGENLVWRSIPSIERGVITGSTSLTGSSFAAVGSTVVLTTSEGIQYDDSFHQHGAQLYNGGYGMGYGSDTLHVATFGTGSSYAFTPAQQQIMVDYLLDGQQWFVRGQAFDYTANGRGISRPNTQSLGLSLMTPVLSALTVTGSGYRSAELTAMYNRLNYAKSYGTASTSSTLALVGNRGFYYSDFMAQQRAAYYSSVKISSTRTALAESINSEGLKDLYLADGVNMAMVSGSEYTNIFPVWDWRRLPGTTAEQDGRSLTPNMSSNMGTATFAGEVSDGMYGATAFNYSRFNVAAKKSWFFFDNEYVALGAGVTAPSATGSVVTTLNQCLLGGTVSYATTSGVTQTMSTGSLTSGSLKWVYQGGVGYYFPTPPASATVQALSQSGSWYSINNAYSTSIVNSNVFSLQVNHPSKPNNDSYAYIVVPGTTAAAMANYGATTGVTILANTTTVQAVEHLGLNETQAVFYSPTTLVIDAASDYWVAPSAPLMLLLKKGSAGITISASNPLAAALDFQIQIGVPLGRYWDGTQGYSTLPFSLAGGTERGATVTKYFPYPLTWDTSSASGWQAGGGTWTTGGPATWTTSLAGTATLPWSDSTDASFAAPGPAPITVQDAVNANSFCISGTGYSFSGGTINVASGIVTTVDATINSTLALAASQTWTAAAPGKTLTVAGRIQTNGNLLALDGAGNELLIALLSGTGGLTKTGSGVCTLVNTANTYTGPTTVGGGLLVTSTLANGGSPSGIGAAANGAANLIFSGGTLQYLGNGGMIDRLFTLVGSTTGGLESSGAGPLVLSNTGALAFRGAGTAGLVLGGSNSGSNVFNMVLANGTSGAVAVVKSGTGRWTLAASNSYSGGTAILGGVLNLGQSASLGVGGPLTISNGTLDLSGFSETVGPLNGSGVITTTSTSAIMLTVNSASASTYTGTILSGAGNVTLTKGGSGTLTLGGTQGYTGATVISGGALGVASTATLAAGSNVQLKGGVLETSGTLTPVLGTGGGQLQWTGSGGFSAHGGKLVVTISDSANPLLWGSTSQFIGGSSALVFGSSTADNEVQLTNNIRLGSSTGTVAVYSNSGSTNDSATLSGVISGTTGLYKTGDLNGLLTLTGSNTFTGSVTIQAGALQITNSAALGAGPKTVTATNGTAGNCQFILNGSGRNIDLPSNISFTTSNQSTDGTVFNNGGSNTISGSFNLTSGGGSTWFVSNSGNLTLAGNLQPTTTGRYLMLGGPSTGLVSGRILDGSGGNVLGLQIMGSGTWSLTGSNTFSVGTQIKGGTLNINADVALGAAAGPVSFSANGALQSAGTVALNSSRSLSIGNTVTADFDILSGKMTVAGPISGSGSLLKTSSGVLGISGSNSYRGGTTVAAGVLAILAKNSLLAGSSLIIGAPIADDAPVPVALIEPAGDAVLIDSAAIPPPAAALAEALPAESPAAVPEPGPLALGGIGMIMLALHARRRSVEGRKRRQT